MATMLARAPCEHRGVPDRVLDLDTPHGLARAHLRPADGAPRAALVLGHGAGGSVTAPDLQDATTVALEAGLSVALVEQPYRVAGRRSAAPARQLDAAWLAVVEQLRDGPLADLPLIAGGRSAGARVACRTAADTGAVAVLCLAFPLHPPRRSPDGERKTRLPELDAVTVPVLVVQGARDPFGMPPPARRRTVVEVAGDHGLKADREGVRAAVRDWLPTVLSRRPRSAARPSARRR
jgi:predicted alpha/beta-hydrolase family hydrolase